MGNLLEGVDEIQKPRGLELLQSPFAFLCTKLRHSVLSPPTGKAVQPSLQKHGEKCIVQDQSEAEEEKHVRHGDAGRDLKGGGFKFWCGGVAELFGDVDKHVHCGVGAVGLELGDQENKEAGNAGGK